jgi:uncharacterized protein YjiK
MRVRMAVLALCVVAAASCRTYQDDLEAVAGSPTAIARATRLDQALAVQDTTGAREAPLAQWLLPPGLQEISGLALTKDNRLLVHDDELGQVSEIDYRRGVLVKRFSLGKGIAGDFEGIAVANDALFMITGKGKLYEFAEGANGTRVEFTVHDTGLEEECAFEGVAFEPATNSLLLSCKIVLNKELRDALVIYRWSLADSTSTRASRLVVPLAAIIGEHKWKNVQPGDITVDPLTGNYVLVASASNDKALIAITPAGAVVFARQLGTRHHQPEGIAISKDGMLIVSDEAAAPPAIITLYRWP